MITTYTIILVVLLIVSFCVLRFYRTNSSEQIENLVEAKKSNQAIKIIKNKLKNTKDKKQEAFLRYKLAQCYELNNNINHSIVEYKIALKIDNGKYQKQITKSLADYLFKINKTEEALQLYLTLIRYEDIASDVYFNIGKIYYQTRNYQTSLDYFKKLLLLDPKHKEGIMYLGFIYIKTGNILDAYVLLNQSIKYFPRNPLLRFNLARVCRKRHEYAEAHMHLEISSKVEKYKYQSLLENALCYLDTNDTHNAIIKLEDIVAGNKVRKDILLNAYYLLALSYQKQKDDEKTIECLTSLIQLDKDFKDAKERLNKLKSGEQNDTLKSFFSLEEKEFIKKSSMILMAIDLDIKSNYRTKEGNFLFEALPINTNDIKNKVFVYISKNITVLNLEETKTVYKYVRNNNSNKLYIISAAKASKRASEYANTHYINIIDDKALYSLLKKTLTFTTKDIPTKINNLAF